MGRLTHVITLGGDILELVEQMKHKRAARESAARRREHLEALEQGREDYVVPG